MKGLFVDPLVLIITNYILVNIYNNKNNELHKTNAIGIIFMMAFYMKHFEEHNKVN